jgi:hypothetical protein
MHRQIGRLMLIVAPLVLLAACGASPQQRTARLLDERMHTQLARQVAAGRAVVERLPDGVRVTVFDQSMFQNDARSLDDQSPDIRADVIEGLLDPSLMRVQVADTSTMPPQQRDLRVRNVEQYFVANGLGSILVPAEAAPAAGAPAGLAVTVGVQCPPAAGHSGYSDGKSHPVCE